MLNRSSLSAAPGPRLPLAHSLCSSLNTARLSFLLACTRKHSLRVRRVRRLFGSPGKLASLSLAGACFASSVATSFGGAGKPVRRGSTRRSLQEFGAPARRVTDVLLVVNTAVFGLQLLSNGSLLALGCKLNPGIAAGEWWRLVTPALLHANLMHLAFNQMALNNLGPTVEAFSGRQRFATVYVASAVMGNVFSYYCSKSPAVGASGAIFGIGGALAVFFYRHRDYFGSASDSVLQSLGQSLALNIVLGLTTRNIDQWAHLGGLVAGAATSFLLGPHLVTEQETKPRGKTQRVLVDRPPLGFLARRNSIQL